MKKTFYVLLTAAALSGLSACNSSSTEETTTDTTTTTDSMGMGSGNTNNMDTSAAATGAAGTEAATMVLDADFAKMAASGGILEVELGRVATEVASDGNVKSFGKMMTTDHSKANTNLKKIAADKKMDLPTTMNPEHQATYDRLSKIKGAEFDRAYMEEMVKDHEKDVTMFKMQADKGTDAELKAMARNTVPVLQEHLEKARSIAAQVSGSANAGTAGGTAQ